MSIALLLNDNNFRLKANELDAKKLVSSTGSIDCDGNRLTNIGVPVADTDVITKAYADAVTVGLKLQETPRGTRT